MHEQRDFLAAVRGAVPGIALGALGKSLIPPELTWQIYRNNYLEGHVAALEDTFSTVRTIVGKEFFRVLAKQFVGNADSSSGDLNEYGRDFPAFLAGSQSNETLPYLADIARLDWTWLELLRAPYQAGDWLAHLLALSPAAWSEATARPAGIVIASPYPVYSIFKLSAEGGQTVSLDLGGQAVLISRTAHVEVTLLNDAAAAFVASWFNGSTLGLAMEAGLLVDKQFDVASLLPQLAAAGAIHSIESAL